MSENNIQVRNLSKSYGKKQVLHDLTLTIPHGMFGLLGRNGAGKTTLMKTIATLLQKQKGMITVCGIPVENAAKVRSLIGYLPQDFNMYGEMTVVEALDYLGTLSEMPAPLLAQRMQLLLEQVNLDEHKHKKVKTLSGGMRQRLGIAQALLHDPKVLIVDEPTAGLDPEERVRFRNLLCEVAQSKTVLLSTHIVGDVEATCENIAIIEGGRLLFGGTINELCALAEGCVYTLEVAQRDLPKIRAAYTVTATIPQGKNSVVRFLSDRVVTSATPVFPNAEDAYIHCLSSARKDGATYEAL